MRRGETMTSGVVTADAEASAQKMTQDAIEGALPRFYFHERG